MDAEVKGILGRSEMERGVRKLELGGNERGKKNGSYGKVYNGTMSNGL